MHLWRNLHVPANENKIRSQIRHMSTFEWTKLLIYGQLDQNYGYSSWNIYDEFKLNFKMSKVIRMEEVQFWRVLWDLKNDPIKGKVLFIQLLIFKSYWTWKRIKNYVKNDKK